MQAIWISGVPIILVFSSQNSANPKSSSNKAAHRSPTPPPHDIHSSISNPALATKKRELKIETSYGGMRLLCRCVSNPCGRYCFLGRRTIQHTANRETMKKRDLENAKIRNNMQQPDLNVKGLKSH